jgi:hypothetical protein
MYFAKEPFCEVFDITYWGRRRTGELVIPKTEK